jgi:hypothetical protein
MVYIVKVEQCGYLIQVKTHNVIFANVSKSIMSFFGAKILTFFIFFFVSESDTILTSGKTSLIVLVHISTYKSIYHTGMPMTGL